MEMREKLDQLEAVQQDRHHQLERKLTEETSLLTSILKAQWRTKLLLLRDGWRR